MTNVTFKRNITTQYGEKTVRICSENILAVQEEYDIFICSAFENSYYPTPGSVIGALDKMGISVQDMSNDPEIDYRNENLGVWLSCETNARFKRIACVELLDLTNPLPVYSSEGDLLKTRLRNLNVLFKENQSLLKNCHSIMIPFLGIGYQKIEPCFSVISMLSFILEIINSIPGIKEITLIDRSNEMVEYYTKVFNSYFSSLNNIKPYVFISYSSKQSKAASMICKYLNENGILTWKAPESIPGGSHYEDELPTALLNTVAVVLLLTPDAEESGWVCKEINEAVSNNKPIIPCKIMAYKMSSNSRFRLENEQILNVWEKPWDEFLLCLKECIIDKIKKVGSVDSSFSERRIDEIALHNNMPKSSFAISKTRPISMHRIDSHEFATEFINKQVEMIREQVGNKKVLLALSGGLDSSVAAALLVKAIGDQLMCIYVNHGLFRKGEPEQVLKVFREELGTNLIYVDAIDRFLDKLAGVDNPETKRKIIGKEFIEAFVEEARRQEKIEFLAQGTIYPDILESNGIKAHHNVGGLPEDLKFELLEPIKFLYKDEVKIVGKALGLPDCMINRQPFPGPSLGVRCLGAITRERLEAVRESDAILREEFGAAGLSDKVWQYFTVVPDIKSTGIRNGKRTYEWPVVLRAVNAVDPRTASIEEIPYPVLVRITKRILNEVSGVNRVLYDLSPKPNASIEWE